MNHHFSRGDKVFHLVHGPGIILEEWGSWFSCRSCYQELRSPNQICSACAFRYPYQEPLHNLQVSGKGTFDILFNNGKIHSINAHWLSHQDTAKISAAA